MARGGVVSRYLVSWPATPGAQPQVHESAERPRRTFPEEARENVQLKVRITREQRRRLQWIQDEDGHDLSTIVGTYIDTEYEERNREEK